jgi:heme o synthase
MAVTFSAVTGFLISDHRADLTILLLAAGVLLLATGASALNQVAERDQDVIMQRTRSRPLPLGKIKSKTALLFSLLLLAAGITALLFIGVVPLLLGILNVFLYNVVYTGLKKVTFLAVIPGAAVGAIPPVIGYTAAGGGFVSAEILLFSGFMFLWQLPHFWLIIVKHRKDYQKAGFKTFPWQMTEKQIKNLIYLWAIFTTAFLAIIIVTGLTFNKYLTAVLLPVNILFIYMFYRMLYIWSGTNATRGAFILMNSFGLLVMVLFILNAVL